MLDRLHGGNMVVSELRDQHTAIASSLRSLIGLIAADCKYDTGLSGSRSCACMAVCARAVAKRNRWSV